MSTHRATLPTPTSHHTTQPRRTNGSIRRLRTQFAFVRQPQVELRLTRDMLG